MSTSPASTPYVEPWLSGTHAEVPAVGRAVLHAFDLALDDLTKWTEGLTDAEVHLEPLGLTSISFHLKHIARSTDRLLTYAEGGQISTEQLALLKMEKGGNRDAGRIAGRGRDVVQQCGGSRGRAGDGGFRHVSRRGAQAVADIDWRSAGSRGRSHAAACGAGGDYGEGAEGAAGVGSRSSVETR